MKKSVLLLVVVATFVFGFVAGLPGVALGDSSVTLAQLVPFIRSGGGVPTLFDGQSTGHGNILSVDLGVNEQQIGIVFGYGIQYGDLISGEWTINDDGTIEGGGCALVVFQPGFYRNLVILDGRYEVYNLPGIQQDSWIKKLISERVQEQAAHYGCPTLTFETVPSWKEDGTSVPFSSLTAPTVAATVASTAVEESATAVSQTAVCQRQETGKGLTLDFAKGDIVVGYRLEIGGAVCEDTNGEGKCWLNGAPMDGKVTDGVICPNTDEIPTVPAWVPAAG